MHNVSLRTHGIRRRPVAAPCTGGPRAGSSGNPSPPEHRGATWLHHGVRRQSADNSPSGPSEQTDPDGTFLRLIHSRARGGERNVRRHQHGPRVASKALARAAVAVAAALGSSIARRDRRTGRRRRGGHCAADETCAEHPASGRAPVHIHPGRRHQHGVHRLGAAQHQLRQVARGARPDGPAERLRERPGAHAAVDHCRRGTRRPRSVAVRRPRSCSRHSGADRRAGQRRPGRSCRLRRQRWGSELRPRLHATRSRLRLDVQRRVRRHQHRLHLADRSPGAGVTGTPSWAPGRPRTARRPRWATGTRPPASTPRSS